MSPDAADWLVLLRPTCTPHRCCSLHCSASLRSRRLAKIDLLALQPWAVDGRNPGDLPDAPADEGREAVSTAGVMVRVARDRLPTNFAAFANAEAAPLGLVNRLLPARMRPNDVPRTALRNFVMAEAQTAWHSV